MSLHAISAPPAAAQELNLQDFVGLIRRRKAVFIEVFVMVLAVGIVATALSKPVYQTHAKLLVTAGSSSVNVVDSNNPIATMLAAAQPDSVDTQLQVLQTGPFLDDARRLAGVVPRRDVLPPSAKMEAIEGTNVIQVTVEGGNRQDVAKFANAIIDLHLERTDLLTTTGLKDTLVFVRKEKQKAETKLNADEKALVQFHTQHPFVGQASTRDTQSAEYAALLARTLEAETNVANTQAEIANLQQQTAKQPRELVDESTKENPRVAKIRDKLDELKLQRMDLLRDYQPASRAVQDLDQELSRIQQQLDAEPQEIRVRTHVRNPAREQLQTRLQELQGALRTYQANRTTSTAQLTAKKALIDSMGPWETQLSDLTSERDATRGAYTMLSDRLRDLEMRAGARLRTARAIERAAVPTSPIRPRKTQQIALYGLLALLLAAATVFLQEYLDDRVNAPEEVERLVPLRVLAHVPQMAPHQPHLVADLPSNAPAAESYRALRSSVSFAGFDAPIRRLQITSPVKGEGKTTTAVNLATAMARDGKTVVLLDADMRAPSVHHALQISGEPGLSETLAGLAILEDSLQATDIENLLVLPAGKTPPNPAELLGSAAFDQLLTQLSEHADIVIVDSPPCLPVTDPVIVAARMDGVVLVLQLGATRKAGLKHTVDLLSHARARVVGIVFNQVQSHGTGYYYYHYSPYYGDLNGNGNGQRNGHTRMTRRQKARASASSAPDHSSVVTTELEEDDTDE
jgi:capsular exopolysaccharide synthesis family protein